MNIVRDQVKDGSRTTDYLVFFAFEFDMRSCCAILIVALTLHALCSGSCLSQTIAAQRAESTDPPCHHQHSSNDSDSPQVPHQDNRPCSLGLLFDGKGGVTAIYVSTFAAILPRAIQISTVLMVPTREIRNEAPSDDRANVTQATILRI
jgi:hypothetical protein